MVSIVGMIVPTIGTKKFWRVVIDCGRAENSSFLDTHSFKELPDLFVKGGGFLVQYPAEAFTSCDWFSRVVALREIICTRSETDLVLSAADSTL